MSQGTYTEPTKAVADLIRLYDEQTQYLREQFSMFANGDKLEGPARAFYPKIRTQVGARRHSRVMQSYGFCDQPGTYEATITRPELFRNYLTEQLTQMRRDRPT